LQIKFDEIRELLPQKFPLLMIDRVIELERGKRAVAIKNITGNELFFLGHFPDTAVMPGTLIIEGMAQTAIILFRKSFEEEPGRRLDEKKLFFFGSAKARFLKPVVPGDQLQIEVVMTKAVSTGAIVEATATVDGKTVAKAVLGFGVKDRESLDQ
jgi:3-hydroxyacyl-[acyl-carrier-protein] dehydratase